MSEVGSAFDRAAVTACGFGVSLQAYNAVRQAGDGHLFGNGGLDRLVQILVLRAKKRVMMCEEQMIAAMLKSREQVSKLSRIMKKKAKAKQSEASFIVSAFHGLAIIK